MNLSDSSVEAVELQQGLFGRPAIRAYNRVLLPDGCMDNGVIKSPAALAENLRQLFAAAHPHPIAGAAVAMSLPETQLFSRLLSFPREVSIEQISATIIDQFSRYLPFEFSEVVYDHFSLGQRGNYRDVLLVAIQRTVLESYDDLIAELNWPVMALELESISSARAVVPAVPAGQATLLLDVGARTTIASWFDDHGLRYTFNSPLAGHYFTQQVVEQLHIAFAEAEASKCRAGVVQAPLNKIIQQAWQPLIEHVRNGIQYVATTLERPTTKIMLIGGSAQLPGIADWLTTQLNCQTILPPLLPNLKQNDMVQHVQREGSLYYNAVGLALGHSATFQPRPKINFYHHK